MLSYRGSRDWARIYTPGVLLGIYTEEEVETIKEPKDITPKSTLDKFDEAFSAKENKVVETTGEVVKEEVTIPDAKQVDIEEFTLTPPGEEKEEESIHIILDGQSVMFPKEVNALKLRDVIKQMDANKRKDFADSNPKDAISKIAKMCSPNIRKEIGELLNNK